jgi:hypothetical protein
MRQPAIIVDVNGTLGDCTERSHFLDTDPRDWDGFFRHMMIDKPIDMVHRFVNAQREWPFYNKVILTTGAPEKYRSLMIEWLDTNSVKYDLLFMRGNFEFIKGFEFKRRLYEDQLKHEYDIVLALEDKEECSDLYRSLGIPCWLVAPCPYPRKTQTESTTVSSRSTSRGNRTRNYGRKPRPR